MILEEYLSVFDWLVVWKCVRVKVYKIRKEKLLKTGYREGGREV